MRHPDRGTPLSTIAKAASGFLQQALQTTYRYPSDRSSRVPSGRPTSVPRVIAHTSLHTSSCCAPGATQPSGASPVGRTHPGRLGMVSCSPFVARDTNRQWPASNRALRTRSKLCCPWNRTDGSKPRAAAREADARAPLDVPEYYTHSHPAGGLRKYLQS